MKTWFLKHEDIKKRLTALVLLAAMLLSLTACGPKLPKLGELIEKHPGMMTEEQMKAAGIYGLTVKNFRRAWGEEYSFVNKRMTWKEGDKYVMITFEGELFEDLQAVEANVSMTLMATVTEFVANTVPIITPNEGQWELSSGDEIFFSMDWFSDEQAAQVKVGTELRIEYDGLLMESAPMQIHEPYSVEVVGWHEVEPAEVPTAAVTEEPTTEEGTEEPTTASAETNEPEPQVQHGDPERAQYAFALGLFQKAAAEKKGENLLVAPLSMQLALAMTANGAKGDTLSELEKVLGDGASMEEVNQYLHGCLNSLQSKTDARFLIADSVWIRDDADRLHVEEDFIKNARDWYDAQVFKEPFDASTVDKLNGWVNEKTEGMIPKVKDGLSDHDMILLVNAMTFDAEWQYPFALEQVHAGTFTALDGREQSVQMMSAEHTSGYIKDEQAKGFLRPYRGGKYSFAALLPDEGVDLYDYIAGLTSERLHEVLSTRQQEDINLSFPKFSYSFDIDMIPLLQGMGIEKLFSTGGEADLTGLGTSSEGNLYISEAFQKTFISVDELGTKAGAVSMMIAVPESAIEISIVLNRPFVYMIIDNETSLPLFMGVVTEISE